MHLSVLIGLYGLAALAVYFVVSRIVTSIRYKAKAKQLGCQDAPHYPGGGFLGLNYIKEMQAADKEQMFPDLLIKRFDTLSDSLGRVVSTYRADMLGQEIVNTCDPENIKAVLATQFEDYDLGPARRNNMMATLGDGIFVQDGNAWKHSREMLRPNFVRDQVSDLELEENHVQELLQVMPVKKDGWTDVTDIQTLFFRLTIDSACEFLFGESVDSQLSEAGIHTRDEKNTVNFAQNFDSAMMHLARRFRLGDQYWFHNPKDFQENNRKVNQFIKHYVDLALKKDLSEKKVSDGQKERYVFLEALAENTRNPEELRAQLLNILLAGRDTTASLLSWLFNQLLRNPHIFTKLRETVIETFGTYEDPKEISFSTLKGCQYLQYCLNETLRLWTVVPGNARKANKATTLPRGGGPDGNSPIFVKPGTDINYTIHAMQRRTDLWGEDALEFKPERFQTKRPGWEYLPFNGGPRICIGQQFALTEASYVVVRLLQKFDKIEPGPNELEGPIKSGLNLTNAPAKNVTLKMHQASAD